MILLDTHILLWLVDMPDRIGKNARSRIATETRGEGLSVSAITFWEVAMAVRKGRFVLNFPVERWRRELLSRGLTELPLNGVIAAQAGMLEGMHGDPADRIIVATALEHRLPLVTVDRQILAWTGQLATIDGRR